MDGNQALRDGTAGGFVGVRGGGGVVREKEYPYASEPFRRPFAL